MHGWLPSEMQAGGAKSTQGDVWFDPKLRGAGGFCICMAQAVDIQFGARIGRLGRVRGLTNAIGQNNVLIVGKVSAICPNEGNGDLWGFSERVTIPLILDHPVSKRR